VIGVAAVIVVAVLVWRMNARRRTAQLRERFGPEYDHTVEQASTRRGAEVELRAREARRDQLDIRPLAPSSRERYAQEWTQVQSRFVDDPVAAVSAADTLVTSVMRERGYPMDGFEQRAADVSVDHPDVVENYRSAHRVSDLSARGEATTEDLRQAMQHYRSLFDDLLEADADEPLAAERGEVGSEEAAPAGARERSRG
jgi:hypothetical protein